MTAKYYLVLLLLILAGSSCKKSDQGNPVDPPVEPPTGSFTFNELKVNDLFSGFSYYSVNLKPTIKLSFSAAIDKSSVVNGIVMKDKGNNSVALNVAFENDDKTIVLSPASSLQAITMYFLDAQTNLKSTSGNKLLSPITINLVTTIDPANKFPEISDQELLTKIQRQTFKYFWDFAHPASGMARERNTSGNTVTSGGSGFGIMAIITGVHRGFITKAEGLSRIQKIVAFLKTADRFHGAYAHWIDGNTGKAIAFSTKDNGGDLVETSFLIQGLLTARQYFNGSDQAESSLRSDINSIYNGVEWDWYRKDNSNTLYWHWSPNYNWDMNMPIRGWNEALITYVLAASSTTHAIPKSVYDNGWANNGNLKNGNSYYGVQLPLGPASGGPLFFSHYSFLGINPTGLSDAYANYETQNKAHALIHYNYAKANPKNFYGYGEDCWGLTASDDINGYLAHEPTNDNGVISPTAALSSFPYTPVESMQALKFFYYKLGDKIFKEYGFTDAFSLHDTWFAESTLAIDQGPIIIMIENYRSKLLWDLFMSCPEVKTGMKDLGFTGPNL
ncbi:beta-glucosidase [Pedobacter ginsengisoli]|uniref:Beta-glucosidase n=1 Tax=Pedobacter ginsengisoli TaxID=363852 RepID=A0A2D1U811_9SPHI|nr:glucoamylase family protein [Pedobacter ginsengisoli]ATP57722.1 beta-glucosidase [Pedobacter ginsengisoli]